MKERPLLVRWVAGRTLVEAIPTLGSEQGGRILVAESLFFAQNRSDQIGDERSLVFEHGSWIQ